MFCSTHFIDFLNNSSLLSRFIPVFINQYIFLYSPTEIQGNICFILSPSSMSEISLIMNAGQVGIINYLDRKWKTDFFFITEKIDISNQEMSFHFSNYFSCRIRTQHNIPNFFSHYRSINYCPLHSKWTMITWDNIGVTQPVSIFRPFLFIKISVDSLWPNQNIE